MRCRTTSEYINMDKAQDIRPQKTQPWRAAWPPKTDGNNAVCPEGVEYGVGKGETVVVDGTSATVKPTKIDPKVAA